MTHAPKWPIVPGLHALIGPIDAVGDLIDILLGDPRVQVSPLLPEDWVHPYDIRARVEALRAEVPVDTMRVFATLSPLVVNEMPADKVHVVTYGADGHLQVTRLDWTPYYADRAKVYQNGELWLAHPDIEGRR